MGKFPLRNIPNDLAPANLAKMSHIRKKSWFTVFKTRTLVFTIAYSFDYLQIYDY